jgi:hypothetical protein
MLFLQWFRFILFYGISYGCRYHMAKKRGVETPVATWDPLPQLMRVMISNHPLEVNRQADPVAGFLC